MFAMEVQFVIKILFSIVIIALLGILLRLYNGLVMKPKRLRSMLQKQGINGPPPAFLLGNIRQIQKTVSSVVKATDPPLIHNCAALLFPFLELWKEEYGIISHLENQHKSKERKNRRLTI